MTIPISTSLTLLGRVKSGDELAWERLVDIYGPFLLGRLRSRGLPHVDAEEVLQDVFRTVYRSIGQFRRDRPGDSFLNWLQTITSSRLADFARKRSRQVEVAAGGSTVQQQLAESPDPLAGEDWSTDAMAQQTVLKRALDLMKVEFREHTWRAFWMSAMDGRTTDEICQELDMKPGAVRQARSKVRKRLAEEFGDIVGDPVRSSPDAPPEK